ncbi:hypothetical protein [Halosimplex halobium]|uniref:hypothetical protein n=1 Tax=Halosimplex halobium TaxID=3396618 RepID=UPI003F56BEE0
MAKFTFLEVHLDGAEFMANAPFSGAESAEEAEGLADLSLGSGEDGDEAGEATDEGGASPFGIVFAFVGLVVLAVAFRRILGGSGEPVLDEAESESGGGIRARL